MEPVTIIGSYLSPYVHKVLVCLAHKRIRYRIDPIVPFFANAEFSRLSPLQRIPVLICDRIVLSDSTVICEYLEERWPQHPMYPQTPEQRARARWLEEFADTRMGDVFIWRLFNQVAIRPRVWGEKTDEAPVAKTLAEDVPAILAYLERELPAEGWICGEFSIADVSIASFFRKAAFARYRVDAARWPRTAACAAASAARGSPGSSTHSAGRPPPPGWLARASAPARCPAAGRPAPRCGSASAAPSSTWPPSRSAVGNACGRRGSSRIGLLADNPLMGPSRPDIAPELHYHPVGNHLVLYRVIQDGIEVVRVVRGARHLLDLV